MSNNTYIQSLKTVLTIIVGLIVIYFISKNIWLLYVAVIISVLSLVSSQISYIIHKVWMGLAKVLSYIMPTILLSVIFYLILFPISLLSKLFNKKDNLLLKNKTASTFINSNKTFTKQSFEKPW